MSGHFLPARRTTDCPLEADAASGRVVCPEAKPYRRGDCHSTTPERKFFWAQSASWLRLFESRSHPAKREGSAPRQEIRWLRLFLQERNCLCHELSPADRRRRRSGK